MSEIQHIYPKHFSNIKISFTQVKDLTNATEQDEKILTIHNRAQCNALENKKQLSENDYFPKMKQRISEVVKQCQVSKEEMHDRHPNNPKLQEIPIPQYPGHLIHIDIYTTLKNLVLTAIDKFSKLAQGRMSESRAIEDAKTPLLEILFYYEVPKAEVIDIEISLSSASQHLHDTRSIGD